MGRLRVAAEMYGADDPVNTVDVRVQLMHAPYIFQNALYGEGDQLFRQAMQLLKVIPVARILLLNASKQIARELQHLQGQPASKCQRFSTLDSASIQPQQTGPGGLGIHYLAPFNQVVLMYNTSSHCLWKLEGSCRSESFS